MEESPHIELQLDEATGRVQNAYLTGLCGAVDDLPAGDTTVRERTVVLCQEIVDIHLLAAESLE